jgi:hypothetical protein
MKNKDIQPALLTRTEIQWLQGKLELSNGYRRKIKSEIRKKLRIYNELEIPLLVKSGFITATSNCNAVTTNRNMINPPNSSNSENCAQNMVGRKGFEPSNPAMSRRYLNQARPPARTHFKR